MQQPATDFSLTDRGPFDRVMRPRKPLILRAVLLALFAWLPLLVLALMARGEGPEPRISFANDIAVHVRFLLVVPLLILAEGPIGERTRKVANTFLSSGLVRPEDRGRFLEIVKKTSRRLESTLAEVAVLVLAVLAVSSMVRKLLHDGVVSWSEHVEGGVEHLSPAGWWYVVMTPVVAFLFLRWVWRFATWCWFLRQVSRLDLHLVATHADRAAGLGFVNLGQNAFAAIPLAASCVIAAHVGTEILQTGTELGTYKHALIAFVVMSILVGMLPAPIFFKTLARTKRAAQVAYGDLSARYSQAFEAKWMSGEPGSEELLGSGDFQSLADLGGAFERLDAMRPSPLDKRTAIAFALAAALPMLPLVLTVMPLNDIVKMLMKAVV